MASSPVFSAEKQAPMVDARLRCGGRPFRCMGETKQLFVLLMPVEG